MKFLQTKRLVLRPFLKSDVTKDYISWLNDSEVNKYSMRRFHPQNDFNANDYFSKVGNDEKILAFDTKDGVHIGNIKYGPVDWLNRNCEISILLGNKKFWNQGLASESIYIVTKHLFEVLGMHRVGADSCNPAFIKLVTTNLGWTLEGTMRQRMFLDGERIDYSIIGILKNEFKLIHKFENG